MTDAILGATALWHLAAVWHFGVTPGRTLARTTRDRPVGVVPAELFRFLAGLNLALVVLGAGAVLADPPTVRLAAVVLAVANATQLAQDLRVGALKIAHGPMFHTIVAGDALFTVANLVVVATAG